MQSTEKRPDGLDPAVVGQRDVSIAILRGTLDEVLLPPKADGWVSIATRIEPNGDREYLAIHVQRKLKSFPIEYLRGHLERLDEYLNNVENNGQSRLSQSQLDSPPSTSEPEQPAEVGLLPGSCSR